MKATNDRVAHLNKDMHNIDWVKRQAKRIKKERGVLHTEALDIVVQKLGFSNWKHFMETNK